MDTTIMRNKYTSFLLTLLTALLVGSVCAYSYRSYSYRSYSYRSYRYYYSYRSYRYYYYNYYNYYYSSSSGYYSAGATAGVAIGIIIAVGLITAAIVAICYYCFRKKRSGTGRVIHTGPVATISSPGLTTGHAVNGSYNYPTAAYTTTAGNVTSAPGTALPPPDYNTVAADPKANGGANQIGQGHTAQGQPPPYSTDDSSDHVTHDKAQLVEGKI